MHKALMNQRDDAALAEEARDVIVLYASRQAMYQSLAETLQKHFVSHDVALVEGAEGLSLVGVTPRLILICARPGGAAQIEALLDSVRQQAPDVPIGLLVDGDVDWGDSSMMDDVAGVLPLSLPLDVLIAITALLLAGGQYAPQRSARNVMQRAERDPIHIAGAEPAREAIALTLREQQILHYVSEGFQNKLIASQMALSEHTVKAHVHKVIAKLGVSNRTQAAAAFLRRTKGKGIGVARDGRQP